MRWPLRYQILLPFALTILGAIAAVSILSAVLATQRAHRQIEEQLQGIAATLADSSFPLTDVVLRQMHGLSGSEFVFWSEDGQVIATRADLQTPLLPAPTVTSDSRQLRLGPPITIGSERYYEMALAVKGRGGQQSGRLHILYPERFWKAERSAAALPPLLIGGAGLGITALLALWLAHRLTRPILELRSQVQRIAQADYSPMPLPARNDEIRELAVAVNQLAAQLTTLDSAIRRSERLALLGQLAGGLAHHLRNNVTGAQMAVQLHARDCQSDHESLSVALRQMALTEQNLKQFLSAPQLVGAVSTPPRYAPCTLRKIVEDVVDLTGPALEHKRVQLTVSDETLGDDALEADADQLCQLLINLVLNASDAAGPGGWVKINLRKHEFENAPVASSARAGLCLQVIDSGPGPPPEIVAKLFQPFATSKPEGIGLGLAVASQIASSHGGDLVFHRAGGETYFEVRLPRVHRSIFNGSPIAGGQRTPEAKELSVVRPFSGGALPSG
jgi:signal transduction histidine kinase